MIYGRVAGVGSPIAYNAASQMTSIDRNNDAYLWNGHYNLSHSYGTNGLNQLTNAGATALSYDGRGNLTASGGTSYAYTSENRLAGTSTSAQLYYEPLGRLLQSGIGGVYTRYDHLGSSLITERDTSNIVQRRYVYGPGEDEPLVWYQGTGTTDRRFLHADERGSVIAVSDGSGAMLAINRYDEYSVPAATNMGRFQYTGQAWLPELGAYYYKARIYAPKLGRFMQTDPIGYGDGVNWYAYVGNDPVNAVDPSGLETEDKGIVVSAPCPGSPNFAYYDGKSQTCFYYAADSGAGRGGVPGPGGDSGGGGGGDGGESKPPCVQSTARSKDFVNATIAKESDVFDTIGNIADGAVVVGGIIAFVNPPLGGAIALTGKVVGTAANVVQGGAAATDFVRNGNTGAAINFATKVAVGAVAGNFAGKFASRITRNTNGQFTRNALRPLSKEVNQTANTTAGNVAGALVCPR